MNFLFSPDFPGFKELYFQFFHEGYIGVGFFFMLSGFILSFTYKTAILTEQVSKREFYLKRIARIYPLQGKEVVIKTGEKVIVKPGESHTFKNASKSEKLVAKFWYEPALNMEWMLQTFGEAAMKHGGSWANVSVLMMMYVMYKARKEYRIAGIPFWLQDVLLGFFAWLAEITGEAKKINLPDSLK